MPIGCAGGGRRRGLDASALAPKSGLVYFPCLSSVHEIETAVSKLSRQELLAFRDWFSEFDAAAVEDGSDIVWFWIGHHSEYDRIVAGRRR
jgi:hypothetical protein